MYKTTLEQRLDIIDFLIDKISSGENTFICVGLLSWATLNLDDKDFEEIDNLENDHVCLYLVPELYAYKPSSPTSIGWFPMDDVNSRLYILHKAKQDILSSMEDKEIVS